MLSSSGKESSVAAIEPITISSPIVFSLGTEKLSRLGTPAILKDPPRLSRSGNSMDVTPGVPNSGTEIPVLVPASILRAMDISPGKLKSP